MPTQYLLNKKNGGIFKTTVIPSIDEYKVIESKIIYGNELEVNYFNTEEELEEFKSFGFKQYELFSVGDKDFKKCYDIGYYSDELINDKYSKILSNLTSSKYKFLILQNGTAIGIGLIKKYISLGVEFKYYILRFSPNFLKYSNYINGGVLPIVLINATVGYSVEALDKKPKFVLCNDFLRKSNPYRYEFVDFKSSPAVGIIYTKLETPIKIEEKLFWHSFEDDIFKQSLSVNNSNSGKFTGTSLYMTTEQWDKVCFKTVYDKITKFYGNPNEPLPNDPYEDESKPGGGGGGHDDGTDPIPLPDLPTISATDSGFITLFAPSQQQVRSLASYMWSGTLFDIDNFRKIFANPMDCILGFSIVPLTVASQGVAQVKVGNISTDLEFPVVANQYVEVDCGSVEVSEYWGAYVDYSPYTKVSIFLPFIGTLPIDVDEVMSRTITVKYHVDLISGSCVAFILVSGGRMNSVLYQYSGQISSSIPITSDSYESIIRGAIDIATTLTSGVARTASSVVSSNLNKKNPISGKLDGVAIASETVGSAANTVMSMKPDIRHSGAVSGSSSIMSMRKPYLIIERPNLCIPPNQNSYTGYPSYITSQLGKLNGMTVVDVVHLDNVVATEEELDMIESLLKGGVIL